MTTIKHTLTIEIELADLPREQREELQEQAGLEYDCDDDEWGLPRAEDISSAELFEVISNAIEWSDELWSGTDHYATIASIKLVKVDHD